MNSRATLSKQSGAHVDGILFGASSSALLGVPELDRRGINITEVWDNDVRKHGKAFAGHVVSAPRRSATRVFIGSSYAKTVAMQLKELGCDYEYLSPFVNYAEFDQYFSPIRQDLLTELDAALLDADSKRALQGIAAFRATGDPHHLVASAYADYSHPQILLRDGSVVVDVGAWEGDTADHFLSRVGPNGRVVCVEPNQQAASKISRDPRISVISAGLWSDDTAGVLDRSSLERGGESGGFRVAVGQASDASSAVRLVRLDGLDLGRVDVIKMDIEGAEREALRGCEATIRHYSPVLMICLYHRWDDLWEIPRLIRSLGDYKFYLGQHTESAVETVLYAIPSLNKDLRRR